MQTEIEKKLGITMPPNLKLEEKGNFIYLVNGGEQVRAFDKKTVNAEKIKECVFNCKKYIKD